MHEPPQASDHSLALRYVGAGALTGAVLGIAILRRSSEWAPYTSMSEAALAGAGTGAIAGLGRLLTAHWTVRSRAWRLASWLGGWGLACVALSLALILSRGLSPSGVALVLSGGCFLALVHWIEEEGILHRSFGPRLLLPSILLGVCLLLLLVFALE